jgi:D-glycero-alpha-D-manno-heptose-7-phosphate kinase
VNDLKNRLETGPVEAAAACRIDCGGTLDIKTFYYPLGYLSPCTFNIALNMKTRVRLLPYSLGRIKISSKGFETEEHPADHAPFSGPMGLMFAIASYFRVSGLHIEIVSESPPRSALGGSSTAAVALIGALTNALAGDEGKPALTTDQTVLLAHGIEEAVAGITCGMQDQLAAAYGGVNAWYWPGGPADPPFRRKQVLQEDEYAMLESRLLVAYCGVPHESQDINGKWIHQFVKGTARPLWTEIVSCTNAFVQSLTEKNWAAAGRAMNEEVDIRRQMTPDVLDKIGIALFETAVARGCGARFTGSGGGGCIWALGDKDDIAALRPEWLDVLSQREDAQMLDTRVDRRGLEIS